MYHSGKQVLIPLMVGISRMGENRSITLLGGEGFIGRNIAAHFSREIPCLSVGTQPSPFEKRSDEFLRANPYQEVLQHESNIIIHLIDNPVPLESFLEQEEQLVKNIGLDARHHLILFSSAVVYANPDSEYGRRKKALENFYQKVCQEKQIRLTILRPFNLYGPYQIPFRPGSLVANLFSNHLEAKPTEINDLEAKRDFLFIGDLVRLLEQVIEEGIEGIHDLGSGQLTTIRELITQIEKVLGHKISTVERGNKDMSQDHQAKGDLLKSITMVDLNEGLRQTLDFYKENFPIIKNALK